MYLFARNLLFSLPTETSHELTLDLLGAAERLRLLSMAVPPPVYDPVKVMGLEFPNRVGLAAGLDKNADYFNALGAIGFGFVEVGTVTPRAQPGNPLPRLFRVRQAEAIINRMGFNNKGVEHLTGAVQRRRYGGVLGINIGKNAATPIERGVDDYLTCMEMVYPYADYIALNISSPNTPGLRDLQYGQQLDELLVTVMQLREKLSDQHLRLVPVAVKIAPDVDSDNLGMIADSLHNNSVDAVIATNTSISREAISGLPHAREAGGLSGAPITQMSTDLIEALSQKLQGELPIIGVGGIMSPMDAQAKIDAGASLVQIYTGFIYRGPGLVHKTAKQLASFKSAPALQPPVAK